MTYESPTATHSRGEAHDTARSALFAGCFGFTVRCTNHRGRCAPVEAHTTLPPTNANAATTPMKAITERSLPPSR